MAFEKLRMSLAHTGISQLVDRVVGPLLRSTDLLCPDQQSEALFYCFRVKNS
jgi:hypothetical protein